MLLALATGCAAIVAGGAAAGGTYIYTEGQLQREYDAPLEAAYSASVAALESLDIEISDRDQKLTEASVTGVDGDTDVWVSLDAVTETKTEVSVRYGLTGDRQASERIHDAIEARL
jgi:hypothetical protein